VIGRARLVGSPQKRFLHDPQRDSALAVEDCGSQENNTITRHTTQAEPICWPRKWRHVILRAARRLFEPIYFKKSCDSVRREVLFIIFIEYDTFPIQNCVKQGDALSRLLFNFYLQYATTTKNTGRDWNWEKDISFWSMLIVLICLERTCFYKGNPRSSNWLESGGQCISNEGRSKYMFMPCHRSGEKIMV
jgi:hypothetical protein